MEVGPPDRKASHAVERKDLTGQLRAVRKEQRALQNKEETAQKGQRALQSAEGPAPVQAFAASMGGDEPRPMAGLAPTDSMDLARKRAVGGGDEGRSRGGGCCCGAGRDSGKRAARTRRLQVQQKRMLAEHYPTALSGLLDDGPITDKQTESTTSQDDKLLIACSSMQGWRVSMEDCHTIVGSWASAGLPDHTLVAVFDGHGGNLTSRLAAEQVVAHIEAEPAFKEYVSLPPPERAISGLEMLSAALGAAFLALDETLHDEQKARDIGSGSTANVVMLTPTHVVCANAGDTRAVYQAGGKVRRLSTDHKPSLSGERRRVTAAGGEVINGRVDGGLAVSRALGDFHYKERKLAPGQQKVTAQPEVSVRWREPGEQLLLVACDGIWDVMSDKQACKRLLQAREQLHSNAPAGTAQTAAHHRRRLGVACEQLLDECLKKKSRDNMSVIAIDFR